MITLLFFLFLYLLLAYSLRWLVISNSAEFIKQHQGINPFIKSLIRFLPAKVFKDERFVAKLITGSVISELFSTYNILTFYGSNKEIPFIISPSLIITDEELDRFLDALDKTLAVGKRNLILNFLKQKVLKK